MLRKLWRGGSWKGLLAISLLNIAYLLRMKNNYIDYFSAGEKLNVTGYVVMVLGDKFFLVTMAALTSVYVTSQINRSSLTEILCYDSRQNRQRRIITAVFTACTMYFLFLLCAIAAVAAGSGLSFTGLHQAVGDAVWLVPDIGSRYTPDMLKLSGVVIGNSFCFVLSVSMLYLALYGMIQRRSLTWLAEVMVLMCDLGVTIMLVHSLYPVSLLGNTVPNLDHIRLNDSVNWPYWLLLNAALLILTSVRNKRREFYCDE